MPLDETDVRRAQQEWATGVVAIGEGRLPASTFVEQHYAYGRDETLFKPTRASHRPIRLSKAGAASYFDGSLYDEDGDGFARGIERVEWANKAIVVRSATDADVMGRYVFHCNDGTTINADFTMSFRFYDDGPKLLVHHSSTIVQRVHDSVHDSSNSNSNSNSNPNSNSNCAPANDDLEGGTLGCIGGFGDALTVVNAARVSFGQQSGAMDERDWRLIRYLLRNGHWSPFRHVVLRFQIKAPEFVMRQLYKHVVGIECTSSSSTKDHAWSEISGRYCPVESFWTPATFRPQSKHAKQGLGLNSDGTLTDADATEALREYRRAVDTAVECYERLLELGVAKEQARAALPLAQFTTVVWTASLQAVLHFIALRDHDHAQLEIRRYAVAMRRLLSRRYPRLMACVDEVSPDSTYDAVGERCKPNRMNRR